MSSKSIRWGIVGPGRIADLVVRDFVHVPNAEVVAVASRTKSRADAFASRYAIPKSYGSYEAIIADPEVDVLYLATPNRQHRKLAIDAVRGGKALLVEKSFATTVAGAQDMVDAARASGRFVMEAMWTRFQPIIVKMRELIASSAIGDVHAVQADLGVDRPYNPGDRLFDPAQGGGAMLDLGVYLVSFAHMVLGAPRAVVAQGSLWPTGVDADSGLLLDHGEGRRSVLFMTLRHATPGQARVFGNKGFIDVLPRFHHPTQMVVHRKDAGAEPFSLPPLGGGYSHELIEVTECLLAGRTESAVMPLADTLAVQVTMNEALRQLGVFPSEEP